METSVAISVTPKIGWLIPMIKTHEIHHELCHTSLRDGSTKIPVKNQSDHFSGIYFLQCKGRHGKMISDLLAFFYQKYRRFAMKTYENPLGESAFWCYQQQNFY